MTYDEAIHIAIEALRFQSNYLRFAVDNNLAEAITTLQAGPLAGMPILVAGDWSGYEICTICGGLVRYDVREAHFQECQAAFLADEVPAA